MVSNPLVPLAILAVVVVVGGYFLFSGTIPPIEPPGPEPNDGDICSIPALDGNASCLTINTFSYDFASQQLSMAFTYREPDCPLCTGDVGNLRMVVVQSTGSRRTFEFGPGNHFFNTNLGANFGILEWWVSDDTTKGVNRFRVDTSGSLLDLDILLNS